MSSTRPAASSRSGSRPTTTTSTARPAAARASHSAACCEPHVRTACLSRPRLGQTRMSPARRRAQPAACGGSTDAARRPRPGRVCAAARPWRSPPRPARSPSRPRSGATPRADVRAGSRATAAGAARPPAQRADDAGRAPRRARDTVAAPRSGRPGAGTSSTAARPAYVRHRRMKRLASAGLVRPMKAQSGRAGSGPPLSPCRPSVRPDVPGRRRLRSSRLAHRLPAPKEGCLSPGGAMLPP